MTLALGMVRSKLSFVTNNPFHRNGQVEVLLLDMDPPLESVGSTLLHRDLLHGNGHQVSHIWALSLGLAKSFFLIKALYKAMVIDFFVTSRPSPLEWSLISFLYIMALFEAMVMVPLLHRVPLPRNGHQFLFISTLSLGLAKSFF